MIAVKNGDDLMIDEISLADDSVLERLNSVLEEEKTLLLAENSTEEQSHGLKAHPNFRIFATMNPSGDFGKKIIYLQSLKSCPNGNKSPNLVMLRKTLLKQNQLHGYRKLVKFDMSSTPITTTINNNNTNHHHQQPKALPL